MKLYSNRPQIQNQDFVRGHNRSSLKTKDLQIVIDYKYVWMSHVWSHFNIWKKKKEGRKGQLWNSQVSSQWVIRSICSRPVCCRGLAHTSLLPTVAAAGFSPVLSGWVKSSAWYQQKATGGSWGGSFCLLERDIRWRNRTLILVSEDGTASAKTDAVFLLRSAVEPISSREAFPSLTSKEPCSILRCWWAQRERWWCGWCEIITGCRITLNRWW